MENTKVSLIKAIFTNVLFVVGVILMVVGFIKGTSTVAKLAFFEKYPLQSYEESRCEMPYYPDMPLTKDGLTTPDASQSAEERKQQQTRCQTEVERGRTVQKVDDVVSSISLFVAGAALALAFKQFIFQKKL